GGPPTDQVTRSYEAPQRYPFPAHCIGPGRTREAPRRLELAGIIAPPPQAASRGVRRQARRRPGAACEAERRQHGRIPAVSADAALLLPVAGRREHGERPGGAVAGARAPSRAGVRPPERGYPGSEATLPRIAAS